MRYVATGERTTRLDEPKTEVLDDEAYAVLLPFRLAGNIWVCPGCNTCAARVHDCDWCCLLIQGLQGMCA
jgi:hypothetical protein